MLRILYPEGAFDLPLNLPGTRVYYSLDRHAMPFQPSILSIVMPCNFNRVSLQLSN